MTIKDARKRLRDESLSDKQVQEILDCFSRIIEVGFQQLESKRKDKKRAL